MAKGPNNVKGIYTLAVSPLLLSASLHPMRRSMARRQTPHTPPPPMGKSGVLEEDGLIIVCIVARFYMNIFALSCN